MGWVDRIPEPHKTCSLPPTEAAAAGSVWKCDECGNTWKIEERIFRRRARNWDEPYSEARKIWLIDSVAPEWLVV